MHRIPRPIRNVIVISEALDFDADEKRNFPFSSANEGKSKMSTMIICKVLKSTGKKIYFGHMIRTHNKLHCVGNNPCREM